VVLGVAIIMLGIAAMLVGFGIFRWQANGWRVDSMTSYVVHSFIIISSLIMCLAVSLIDAVRWSFGLGGSLVLIYEVR
jgi:uncharacterized membrane protein YidH (DUF202 family)